MTELKANAAREFFLSERVKAEWPVLGQAWREKARGRVLSCCKELSVAGAWISEQGRHEER